MVVESVESRLQAPLSPPVYRADFKNPHGQGQINGTVR